jgi:hypothetical protein
MLLAFAANGRPFGTLDVGVVATASLGSGVPTGAYTVSPNAAEPSSQFQCVSLSFPVFATVVLPHQFNEADCSKICMALQHDHHVMLQHCRVWQTWTMKTRHVPT